MIASEQGSVSATVCDIRLNSSWSRLIILWMKSNWAEDHDSNLWNENMADPGCLSRSTWYIRKTVVENLACVASVSVRFGSKKNLSPLFSRGQNTENPVLRSLLHGNACYSGYGKFGNATLKDVTRDTRDVSALCKLFFAFLYPVQTPYFTWAESYANEGEQRTFLICIRFGSCEVRRLLFHCSPRNFFHG